MPLAVQLPHQSVGLLDRRHLHSRALRAFSVEGLWTSVSNTVHAKPIVGATDVADALELLLTQEVEATNLFEHFIEE